MSLAIPVTELNSLGSLLKPDIVKAVLEAYTGNGEKPPGRYVVELAGKVLSIARSIGMGKEQIAALDDLRYEYAAVPHGTE